MVTRRIGKALPVGRAVDNMMDMESDVESAVESAHDTISDLRSAIRALDNTADKWLRDAEGADEFHMYIGTLLSDVDNVLETLSTAKSDVYEIVYKMSDVMSLYNDYEDEWESDD